MDRTRIVDGLMNRRYARLRAAIRRAYGVRNEWASDIIFQDQSSPETALGRYAREQINRAVSLRHRTRGEYDRG